MNSAATISWRRIAFSLVVLGYAGFLGFINVMMFLPGNPLSAMGHFDFVFTGDTHNLVHELMFAFIIGTAAVGLLSQLWKPKENFAGQLMALIAWVVMIVTAAFTGNWVPQPFFLIFGGLTLLATILHPAGRGLFNWFSVARVNRLLLALVIIATVPLFLFASTNIDLQTSGNQGSGTGFSRIFGHTIPKHGGDEITNQEAQKDQPLDKTGGIIMDDGTDHDQKHIAEGHYRNMAAFSFIVLLVGLLASLRPKGWRLAAWVAGGLQLLLGLTSVALPDAESSLGLAWGLAAIVWGVTFIVAAERTRDA
jgi:hypothetical protein